MQGMVCGFDIRCSDIPGARAFVARHRAGDLVLSALYTFLGLVHFVVGMDKCAITYGVIVDTFD